eukprot:671431-Lingulodinium_polyedra.AAC.1
MHRRGAMAANNAPATGAEAVAAPHAFIGGPRSRAGRQGLGHAINGSKRTRRNRCRHRENR